MNTPSHGHGAPVTGGQPWLTPRRREDLLGYALLAPILLVLGLLIFVPLAIVFWDSLHNKTFTGTQYDFVGLDNYTELLLSPDLFPMFVRTAVWTAVSVAGQVLVGLGLALLLNRAIRGRALFRGLFLLPWVIPVVVIALIWKWMLNDLYGVVNFVLGQFNPDWFGLAWYSDELLVLPTLIAINIWRGAPFIMVILLAGLQSVPGDLIEASSIDGANRRQQFRHITLPHLRAILVVVSLVFILFNFNNFDLVWLSTKGGPLDRSMILSVQTYELAFASLQISRASALAVIMLAVVAVMAVVYLRVTQRREDRERL
jgi:multiple sugar transport system permease protein